MLRLCAWRMTCDQGQNRDEGRASERRPQETKAALQTKFSSKSCFNVHDLIPWHSVAVHKGCGLGLYLLRVGLGRAG